MKFWDTSALFALMSKEFGTRTVAAVFEEDPSLVVCWGTQVELASAAARLRREGRIDDAKLMELIRDAGQLSATAEEIRADDDVRTAAMRVIRLHDLRAAHALQLAAALIWAGHGAAGTGFVCLDGRLRAAAEKEGFAVLPAEESRERSF